MDYLMGIDGGGTKTSVMVYDLSGQSMWQKEYGPGNIVLQEQQTIQLIQHIIQEALQHQPGNCLYVLIGLAGFGVFNRKQEITCMFQQFSFPVEFINDAELALLSKHQGQPGLLAIAGTGSVFYGNYQQQFYRVGGWGHLLGDEGSGYSLGMACYRQLTKELDAGQELSDFSKGFLNFLGASNPLTVIRKVYQQSKEEIAHAALFLARESDFELARLIQQSAAEDLATGVKKLLLQIPEAGRLPLAVAGSVLEKNQLIFAAFSQFLADDVTEIIRNREPNNRAVVYRWQEVSR